MADHFFTNADMEANVLELGEWIEEMLEAIEGGHEDRPLCPPIWSNGTQVPLETQEDLVGKRDCRYRDRMGDLKRTGIDD